MDAKDRAYIFPLITFQWVDHEQNVWMMRSAPLLAHHLSSIIQHIHGKFHLIPFRSIILIFATIPLEIMVVIVWTQKYSKHSSVAAVKTEYLKIQDFPILTNERERDYNEINP